MKYDQEKASAQLSRLADNLKTIHAGAARLWRDFPKNGKSSPEAWRAFQITVIAKVYASYPYEQFKAYADFVSHDDAFDFYEACVDILDDQIKEFEEKEEHNKRNITIKVEEFFKRDLKLIADASYAFARYQVKETY